MSRQTLARACIQGNMTLVNQFIPIASNHVREHAFSLACQVNQSEVIKRFLQEEKMNPNCFNGWPLKHAIYNGCMKTAFILLDDPRVQGDQDCFNHACIVGHLPLVQKLLDKGKIDVHEGMYLAKGRGNHGIVKFLSRQDRSNCHYSWWYECKLTYMH